MVKKELKKFCNLQKYISQVDPELHDAFEKLCMLWMLKVPKGADGITFLLPKEKAYREKIINGAYSTKPESAIEMMKSLILKSNYAFPQHFTNSAVNMLNQKLQVKEATDKHVVLENGLKLVKDDKYVPLEGKSRISVYTITGKGEIPTDGPISDVISEPKRTGGGNSAKKELQSFLEDSFAKDMRFDDNIYVKKVAYQLFLIKENSESLPGNLTVTDYLGNDEFSDSYLLDMFCDSEYPKCFSLLLDGLQNTPEIMNATREKYIRHKSEAIKGTGRSEMPNLTADRVKGIRSPMEIRQRINKLYKNDEEKIGKDLFIVFSNVCRDLWQSEVDSFSKAGAFKNYAYMASNLYNGCCKDILNHEFDVARDLTLYGNLLKSDVCLYYPSVDFSGNPGKDVDEMPSPLDMTIFSLCKFINKRPKMTGGRQPEYVNLEGF